MKRFEGGRRRPSTTPRHGSLWGKDDPPLSSSASCAPGSRRRVDPPPTSSNSRVPSRTRGSEHRRRIAITVVRPRVSRRVRSPCDAAERVRLVVQSHVLVRDAPFVNNPTRSRKTLVNHPTVPEFLSPRTHTVYLARRPLHRHGRPASGRPDRPADLRRPSRCPRLDRGHSDTLIVLVGIRLLITRRRSAAEQAPKGVRRSGARFCHRGGSHCPCTWSEKRASVAPRDTNCSSTSCSGRSSSPRRSEARSTVTRSPSRLPSCSCEVRPLSARSDPVHHATVRRRGCLRIVGRVDPGGR